MKGSISNNLQQKPKILSRFWRLNHIYHIVNKAKQVVQFKFNPWQLALWEAEQAYKLRFPWRWLRFIILKARQIGFTTYKVIYALDRCLFYKNQEIIISAHNLEKAQEIFERIVKFAYDSIPPNIMTAGGVWIKPKTKYSTRRELYFPTMNSRIRVVVDSRSGTPSVAHLTEFAFVQKGQEMLAGTIPSLHESADLTIETTANGIGNFFYPLWTQNYKGEWAFVAFFYPWFKHPENRMEVPEGFDIDAIPDIIKHIKAIEWITPEQVYWYVDQWKTLWDFVLQEHPSTAEEAFLGTGRPVFDIPTVKELQPLVWRPDELIPWLRFYNENVPKNEYEVKEFQKMKREGIAGCDTAEGIEGWDYSTIVWRHRTTKKLLITYRGHIDPHKLCEIFDRIYALGYSGMIGIERNNTGIATLLEAKNHRWYHDLYQETTVDKINNRRVKKYGWRTTTQSKVVMIQNLAQSIRTKKVTEFNQDQKGELMTYVYDEAGSTNAIAPNHDDFVIADAICDMMSQQTFDR